MFGFANINETWGEARPHSLDRTSAEGIYPQGQSPCGLLDCTGNVWECCLNKYADPDDIDNQGEELRSLRGGSWDYDQDDARAASRNGNDPHYRNAAVGFRVLCVSPIDADP